LPLITLILFYASAHLAWWLANIQDTSIQPLANAKPAQYKIALLHLTTSIKIIVRATFAHIR
jgi:hypothetical protein